MASGASEQDANMTSPGNDHNNHIGADSGPSGQSSSRPTAFIIPRPSPVGFWQIGIVPPPAIMAAIPEERLEATHANVRSGLGMVVSNLILSISRAAASNVEAAHFLDVVESNNALQRS